MFKNKKIEVRLADDKSDWTHTPPPARTLRIDPEDLNKIGEVAKKTAIVGGAVAAGYKIVDTACKIAIIYAQK